MHFSKNQFFNQISSIQHHFYSFYEEIDLQEKCKFARKMQKKCKDNLYIQKSSFYGPSYKPHETTKINVLDHVKILHIFNIEKYAIFPSKLSKNHCFL